MCKAFEELLNKYEDLRNKFNKLKMVTTDKRRLSLPRPYSNLQIKKSITPTMQGQLSLEKERNTKLEQLLNLAYYDADSSEAKIVECARNGGFEFNIYTKCDHHDNEIVSSITKVPASHMWHILIANSKKMEEQFNQSKAIKYHLKSKLDSFRSEESLNEIGIQYSNLKSTFEKLQKEKDLLSSENIRLSEKQLFLEDTLDGMKRSIYEVVDRCIGDKGLKEKLLKNLSYKDKHVKKTNLNYNPKEDMEQESNEEEHTDTAKEPCINNIPQYISKFKLLFYQKKIKKLANLWKLVNYEDIIELEGIDYSSLLRSIVLIRDDQIERNTEKLAQITTECKELKGCIEIKNDEIIELMTESESLSIQCQQTDVTNKTSDKSKKSIKIKRYESELKKQAILNKDKDIEIDYLRTTLKQLEEIQLKLKKPATYDFKSLKEILLCIYNSHHSRKKEEQIKADDTYNGCVVIADKIKQIFTEAKNNITCATSIIDSRNMPISISKTLDMDSLSSKATTSVY